MELREYYKILNLRYGATKEEIKDSYRKLAKKFHPDINPTTEAKRKFIEINKAYEYLSNLPPNYFIRETQKKYASDELKKRRNYHDEEFHKKARERVRIKHEQMKQKQEAFKKSGMYDVFLLLQYFLHFVLVTAAALLVFFPFYISITQHSSAFVYLFFFWLTGGFLCFYIITNRKKFFRLGKFYYTFSQLKEIIFKHPYLENINCYYCKNQVADALPYKVHLLKVRDVVLNNKGPLQHHVGYKRKNVSIVMPRSKKALIVHLISSFLRVISIFIAIAFLNINAVIWRFILGLVMGTLLAFVLQFTFKTKARNSYIFTYGFTIKVICWLLIISFFSSFDIRNFNIYGSEKTGVVLVLLFLLDPLIESAIKLFLKDKYIKPLIKQPPKVEELINNNFQYYLEISGWSMIYPMSKWIFG